MMSSSVRFWLILFILSCLVLPYVTHAATSERANPQYVFQFGDSISDTGNLVLENPVGAQAFANLPYGQTMGQPTGRCSDGLLMIDYFMEAFKLPFLSPHLAKNGNFSHGVNFAVAGSTALDNVSLLRMGVMAPVTRSSLFVQLQWFRDRLSTVCSTRSECHDRLINSLALIETGGNDYNYAFLLGKSMEEVRDMVPYVVSSIKEAVREVLNLGVSRVFVPGNFPIGCMPIYLTQFETQDSTKYDSSMCLKELNEFARFHNQELKRALDELQHEYPDASIIYGDYYGALSLLMKNADSLGFDKGAVQKACCGSGENRYNFDLRKACGYQGASVCESPSQRISWDGVHLTQQAYSYMAQWLWRRSFQ